MIPKNGDWEGLAARDPRGLQDKLKELNHTSEGTPTSAMPAMQPPYSEDPNARSADRPAAMRENGMS